MSVKRQKNSKQSHIPRLSRRDNSISRKLDSADEDLIRPKVYTLYYVQIVVTHEIPVDHLLK